MDAEDVRTGEDALRWIAAFRRRNSRVLDNLEHERGRRKDLADLERLEREILDGTALVANENRSDG